MHIEFVPQGPDSLLRSVQQSLYFVASADHQWLLLTEDGYLSTLYDALPLGDYTPPRLPRFAEDAILKAFPAQIEFGIWYRRNRAALGDSEDQSRR